MQRFFFDLQFDDEKPSEDEEGTLLPDVEAAQLEATRSLSDFSRAMSTTRSVSTNSPFMCATTVGPFWSPCCASKSNG